MSGTSNGDEMSDREGDGSDSTNPGLSAKALDELEERLVERIMRKMASRDGEEAGPSRQASSGGERAIVVQSGRSNKVRGGDRDSLPLYSRKQGGLSHLRGGGSRSVPVMRDQ